MHVGVLIDRFEPRRGGMEAALARFVEALCARGDEVSVFAQRAAPGAPGVHRPVRVRRFTRGAAARALAEELALAARRARCDVTVAVRHVAHVDLLWLHGGAHEASVRAKREAARGMPLDEVRLSGRHRVYAALEREAVSGGAGCIVVPSRLTRDELARCHGAALVARVEVAPNGVDLARFQPAARPDARARLRARLALPEGLPLVVLAARNPLLKGAEPLARAAGATRLPLALLLAGTRDVRTWRRRLARHLAPGQRLFVLAEADPLELAAGADVAAQPTWRDPCPLATLEALAVGTPILTTARNGAVEDLPDGARLARVRDPSDAVGLADGLQRLLVGGVAPSDDAHALLRDARAALDAVLALVDAATARRRGAP